MKFLIFVFTIFLSLSVQADICFENSAQLSQNFKDDHVILVSMSCQELDETLWGLEAFSVSLDVTTLGLACTGFGLPATLAVGGASVGIKLIKMYISQLPCDRDRPDRSAMKKMICQELNRSGLSCNPSNLQM